MKSNSIILEVQKVTKVFGGLTAVDDVTFSVCEKEIKGVIGPNGAGKTTLFNLISKVTPLTSGKIWVNGKDISNENPYDIVKHGITRTFQNINLFENMSVIENVMLGMHYHTKTNIFDAVIKLGRCRKEEKYFRKKSLEHLQMVGLEQYADAESTSLAFGNQRLLEIARTLATEPKIILLDEPAAGLNSHETDELAILLKKINEQGITMLVIEHDMGFTMDLCDEIVVLDYGKKIAEGTPREIQKNEKVISAYLGDEVYA